MLSNNEVFAKVEAVLKNATRFQHNVYDNHEVNVICIKDCNYNQVGIFVAKRSKFEKDAIVATVFLNTEQANEFFVIMNTVSYYRCVEDSIEKSLRKENGILLSFYPDTYLGERIVKFSGKFN